MAFSESVSPDITESIPARLSGRELAQALKDFGLTADVTIDDLPFRLAASDERPYRRQSAPIRKQQLDTSREAGEQTLQQWWIRSQTSWHRGAGINFYEPGVDEGTEYRFKASQNIEVFERDQITLLRKAEQLWTGSGTVRAVANIAAGTAVEGFVVANETRLRRYRYDGTLEWETADFLTSFPLTIAIAPEQILVADKGDIWSLSPSDGTPTRLWTLPAGELLSPRIWWTKERIIMARVGSLYELTLAGGDVSTITPFYTTASGQIWMSLAETPGAILMSAVADAGSSYVYAINLTENSAEALPKLGQPTVTAEFPYGEVVRAVGAYLGRVVVATSKGARVGVVRGDGSLQYGPLLFEGSCEYITFGDRFAYVTSRANTGPGLDGATGVFRIDLSEMGDDLRAPWAWDMRLAGKTDAPLGLAALSTGQVVAAMGFAGLWWQSPTTYEPSGYLDSGAIRFATTEPKQFHYARLRTKIEPGHGSVNLSVITRTGERISIITVSDSGAENDDIRISYPTTPQEYLSFRLTLEAGPQGSPVVESLAVKAVPLPARRQRLLEVPLFCSDREQDRFGQTYHGHGYSRLAALEELEAKAGVVRYRDTTTGEALTVVIEEIRFDRTTPPKKNNGNFGGILTLVLRTV